MTQHEMPEDFENQRDIADANARIRKFLASEDVLEQILSSDGPVLSRQLEGPTNEGTDNNQ